jgi:hypothetical protein
MYQQSGLTPCEGLLKPKFGEKYFVHYAYYFENLTYYVIFCLLCIYYVEHTLLHVISCYYIIFRLITYYSQLLRVILSVILVILELFSIISYYSQSFCHIFRVIRALKFVKKALYQCCKFARQTSSSRSNWEVHSHLSHFSRRS